jgi:hypothetical protein
MINEFDCLFNTDWNKGNDSTMKAVERSLMNERFLKFLHKSLKEEINSKKIKKEEQLNVGFID